MDFLIQLAGWSLLPKLGTKLLLGAYYHLNSRPTDPNLVQKHYRIAYSILIAVYLVYSVIQAELKLDTNFYHILESNPSDSSQLKQMFRKLSLNYHPDKNPGNEQMFIKIQSAYAVLKDPVKQKVYDRFGAATLACKTCRSFLDYQANYISGIGFHYIGTLVTLIVIDFLGVLEMFYWRIVCLFGVFVLELFLIFGEIDVLPFVYWRTIAEKAMLLRSLYLVFSVGLGQFHFKDRNATTSRQKMELIEQIVDNECFNAQNFVAKKLEPYNNGELSSKLLRAKIEAVVLDKIINEEPEYKLALKRFTAK